MFKNFEISSSVTTDFSETVHSATNTALQQKPQCTDTHPTENYILYQVAGRRINSDTCSRISDISC